MQIKLRGFTLLELLIVIGIIAILAVGVVVVLNPAEYLKQSRDTKRILELDVIDKALNFYTLNNGSDFGTTSVIYISIPDTSSTCNNVSSTLPILPTNWRYNCVVSDNLRKIDGQGWMPVNFTNLTMTPPLSVLPVDPLNNSDSYYSYTLGSWKLTTNLESQKFKDKKSNSNNIFYSLCPGKIKDNDNNEYTTVLINGQCWMAKNLNRGTKIVGSSSPTNNGTVEKYCYSDLDANCNTDGGLYQWNETMNYNTAEGGQGICPNGWHIPIESEFYALENYLKDAGQTCSNTRSYGTWSCDTAGAKLKASGASEFGGLLAGYRSTSNPWFGYGPSGSGQYANFWTSSQYDGTNVWSRALYTTSSTIARYYNPKTYGFSIRCLKD